MAFRSVSPVATACSSAFGLPRLFLLLRLDGLGLLFGLLLLLSLGRGRLFVVVVAAADQGEPGSANAGASARLQHHGTGDRPTSQARPVVVVAHFDAFRRPGVNLDGAPLGRRARPVSAHHVCVCGVSSG